MTTETTKIHEARCLLVDAIRDYIEAVVPDMPADSTGICRTYADHLATAVGIFAKKQRAYGPDNVQEMGGEGVLRRAREKLTRVERIETLGLRADAAAYLEDGPPDITNFGVILAMVVARSWPGAEWKGKPRD